MVSVIGFDEALARLYRDLKISDTIGEKLKREHGVTSLTQLIDQRLALFEFVKKNISPDATRLLAPVDYILERSKFGDHEASISSLFPLTNDPDTSFAYFLARGVETKGLYTEKQLLQKTTEASSRRKLNAGGKWIIDNDREHWKNDVIQVSDNEESNEEALRSELRINEDDSPWTLDEQLQNIVLMKLPEAVQIPVPLFRKLYAHQRVGVEWMADLYIGKTGGILGDEMGMGKTLQSLAFLLCLMNTGAIRNALIVCPNAIVRTTWRSEALGLLKYFGLDCNIQVEVVTSDMPEIQRTKILHAAKNCTTEKPYLVVSPYSQFRDKRMPRGYKPLKKEFDYVVLDEAHKARTKTSNTAYNLKKIIGKRSRILMLTGTPLMNKLEELYRILTLATGHTVLDKWEAFRSSYVKPIEAARQRTATEHALQHGSKVLKELQEKIKSCVLMRKRKDHLGDIVPRNFEWDCWCALSPEQRELYQGYLQSEDSNAQGIAQGDHKCVLPVIGKLRMICGHPLLHSRGNVMERCQKIGVTKVIEMSPKLKLLVDNLKRSCEEGHRALVFTHFIDMLDIMEFVLNSTEGIDVCRIDGKTSAKPRKLEAIVNDFNSETSIFNVMLVSIKAGGEGLTLTGANKCYIYDPVWSQAESDQAVARICRPGQKRECESIYMIAAGTVEEKMFGKQVYKGLMGRTVLGENTDQDSLSVTDARLYNKDELSQLFELEPHGICKTIERLDLPDEVSQSKKCSIPKDHPSIVGLTRRSDIYNLKKRKVGEDYDDEGEVEREGAVEGEVEKYGTINNEMSPTAGSDGGTGRADVQAEAKKREEDNTLAAFHKSNSVLKQDDIGAPTEQATEKDGLRALEAITGLDEAGAKGNTLDASGIDTTTGIIDGSLQGNDSLGHVFESPTFDVEEVSHSIAI